MSRLSWMHLIHQRLAASVPLPLTAERGRLLERGFSAFSLRSGDLIPNTLFRWDKRSGNLILNTGFAEKNNAAI